MSEETNEQKKGPVEGIDLQRRVMFRAWDDFEQIMYSWHDINNILNCNWFKDTLNNDTSDILMQFTGLQDKNGNDIYEGDILRGHITGICYIVFFDSGAYFAHCGSHDTLRLSRADFCNNEVIGNIFENPELIKDVESGT